MCILHMINIEMQKHMFVLSHTKRIEQQILRSQYKNTQIVLLLQTIFWNAGFYCSMTTKNSISMENFLPGCKFFVTYANFPLLQHLKIKHLKCDYAFYAICKLHFTIPTFFSFEAINNCLSTFSAAIIDSHRYFS